MRILNEANDESLSRIIVYLTLSEASELRDSLMSILETKSHHEHIASADFKKELTISVYDPHRLESFDERSRTLIDEDI
jgi:hypothetical protein